MTTRPGSFVYNSVCDFPSDSAMCYSDLNVRGELFLIKPRSSQKSTLNFLIHFPGNRHTLIIIIYSRCCWRSNRCDPGGAETPSDGLQGLQKCGKYFCAWVLKNIVTLSLFSNVILWVSVMYISCTNCTSQSRIVFLSPSHNFGSIRETFSNQSGLAVSLSLLFLNKTRKRKYFLLPLLMPSGYRSNSIVLSISGHRVKLEDQKMQFSNRLSEIEHYQRSMRLGQVNNNPRPQGMSFF